MDFYAHSSPDGKPPPDGWQPLKDHLRGVASVEERLAESTHMEKAIRECTKGSSHAL